MLNAVIRFALRYRPVVVALAVAALAYGGYLATQMPIDVLPDLNRPRVVVMTESHGLAPEEVEALVTFPIESAVLGATGVQAVRSQSGFGLSVITVDFDWGTDIYLARQIVQERLATVADSLPPGIKPQMTPVSSLMGQILIAGMYRQRGPGGGLLAPVGTTGLLAEWVEGGEGDPALKVWRPTDRRRPDLWEPVGAARAEWLPPRPVDEEAGVLRRARVVVGGDSHEARFLTELKRDLELRTLADWVVRQRLLKEAGVAQVITMGGGRKQYQVLVDPAALLEYGVSLQEVEQALRANNLNATGSFAVQGDRERAIRVLGLLGPGSEQVLRELKQVPVRTTDRRTIPLGQVATVREGPEVKRGDASVNGVPGVAVVVSKQPGTDTRALTDRLTEAMREAEATLPADVVLVPDLFKLKNFIDRGVYNVGEALVLGAALVILVLFLFLLNFRTTFISLTAIPLSLAVTVLVFNVVGSVTGRELSINVMVLGGLAVAMGELVDDAIVDVENIFRRLRENYASPHPRPVLRVVYEASVEVRGAIVYGTAMVILVFLPLFALSGIEGRLFAPLGVAYIVSILASLLVSLTVTPVLSSYLLPRARAAHRRGDSFLVRWLKRGAARLVRLSMAAPRMLLLFTWLLVGLAAWQMTRLGADFLPPFDEGSVQVNIYLPPGSSLEASNRMTALVDAKLRRLMKLPENPGGPILAFVRRSGRAELDEHAEPPSANEYILSIDPESGQSREEIITRLREEIREEVPGVDVEVEQPLAHLISHMLSGVTAQIAIEVYGDDLETLNRLAREVRDAAAGVEGATPPVIEAMTEVEELHIRLRPEDLEYYGVDREYVARFVQTALQGEVVSQVIDGQRRFDLLVRLEEPYRTDYAHLGRLRLDLPGAPRGPGPGGEGEAGDVRGRQVYLSDLADIGPGLGANQIKRDNMRRRIVIRANALGRDLASVVGDIRARVAEQVNLPTGYFIEYGGQFEAQQRATRLIAALAAVSLVGMFLVLYMAMPSARVVLQILNAVPIAFVGGVAALTLTGQSLSVAALVGFISLGGIAARNGILLVTHYFHLMRYEGEGFTPQMILRGSLERLSPVLMTALTAGIALLPLVLGGLQPGREILYPVATVILGGLITSTFCEFLIHPGLFWRFSGRGAYRLAQAEETSGVFPL